MRGKVAEETLQSDNCRIVPGKGGFSGCCMFGAGFGLKFLVANGTPRSRTRNARDAIARQILDLLY